jgi:hypothetical protein
MNVNILLLDDDEDRQEKKSFSLSYQRYTL